MKKVLAISLAFLLLFASCKAEKIEGQNESSAYAQSESSSSKKPKPTSSKNDSSSIASDESSSRKGVLRGDKNSSDSLRRPVYRSEEDAKLNVSPTAASALGAFRFSPDQTLHLGEENEAKVTAFEEVLASGCFNTVILSREQMEDNDILTACGKNCTSYWLELGDVFDREKENINDYLSKIEKNLAVAKSVSVYWENFAGFYIAEPIKRGYSNEDFLLLTKVLYSKFKKRCFTLFNIEEFLSVSKKSKLTYQKADENGVIHPDAAAYVTDAGFISDSIDARDGADVERDIRGVSEKLSGVTDGKSYYSELAKHLTDIISHNVNFWFTASAKNADTEEFCVEQLKFLRSLLEKQRFRGGILLDGYSEQKNTKGLEHRLVLRDAFGEQVLHPTYEKWKKYSEQIRELTSFYKKRTSVLALDFFYGVDLPQTKEEKQ